MKEYNGLEHLKEQSRDITCPKCNDKLEVVLNGFFHGELFYCPTEKKVFCIFLKEITNKAGNDFINQCKETFELDEVRKNIIISNVDKVKKFLATL